MNQPIPKKTTIRLRTEREILATLKEYEDRVWYCEMLDLLHMIECHDGEVPEETDFDRRMARKRRLESKYGDTLDVEDFGDVMFLAGKLAALHYVANGWWDDLGILRRVGWKLEAEEPDDDDYEHSEV